MAIDATTRNVKTTTGATLTVIRIITTARKGPIGITMLPVHPASCSEPKITNIATIRTPVPRIPTPVQALAYLMMVWSTVSHSLSW